MPALPPETRPPMAKRFPIKPAHPERQCWGCDLYCATHDMRCGNGSVRTAHPMELFGEDWNTQGLDAAACPPAEAADTPPVRSRATGA